VRASSSEERRGNARRRDGGQTVYRPKSLKTDSLATRSLSHGKTAATARARSSAPRSSTGIAAPGFAAIEKLVKEWRPDALVVGLPVAERGEHPLAKRVQRFARQLEGRFRLPVERVDERYTSVEAQSRLRGRRDARHALDSVSAQLILEQYFHEQRAA